MRQGKLEWEAAIHVKRRLNMFSGHLTSCTRSLTCSKWSEVKKKQIYAWICASQSCANALKKGRDASAELWTSIQVLCWQTPTKGEDMHLTVHQMPHCSLNRCLPYREQKCTKIEVISNCSLTFDKCLLSIFIGASQYWNMHHRRLQKCKN